MSPSTKQSGAPSGFSTGQVLDWLDLNAETLRYWKGILAPISGRDGRSSRYTFEEIVALAVIGRATNQLQVPIKNFAAHAQELFNAVAAYIADEDDRSFVFIHGDQIEFGRPAMMPPVAALAIVRIDQVLVELRERMTAPASAPPSQLNLFQLAG